MKRPLIPALAALAALGLAAPDTLAQTVTGIDATNWGTVTDPVYGTTESGPYSGAELFAGPRKFDGLYYHGVLPNGRIVKPAGQSAQVGMNPLGATLTPDGKFLIVSNDDERNTGLLSLKNPTNMGGYSLSVVSTKTLQVVSQIASGPVYIGMQATGSGPYTIWASGGPSNSVKTFSVSAAGVISALNATGIVISPILPAVNGYVSNYVPDAVFNTPDANGNFLPAPSNFNRATGAQTTFPAGSALSPDGKYLYVACNGDNSVAVIDTRTQAVVKQVPVGYFPYGVSVSRDGSTVMVANWGVTAYKFAHPNYDSGTGKLTALATTGPNKPDGFYVPPTSTGGANPQTSSVSILTAPGGNGAVLALNKSVYEGQPGGLDDLYTVGETHPSATAVVRQGGAEVLYVAKANHDSLGVINVATGQRLPDVDLSPLSLTLSDGHTVHGSYPNALAVSPDNTRLYVAEAGINSVAVLDTTPPTQPRLLGRIPTGWYPTGVTVSPDGKTLYILNAKGIGEDINPATTGNPTATGVESFTDSNFIFGSVQKVNANIQIPNAAVLSYNFAQHTPPNQGIVPLGGAASTKIKHVFFILHENKTFDAQLGNLNGHFGPFASLTYNNPDGSAYTSGQNTGVTLNTQLLAKTFAAAVNYYSDSEESDAGHQFAASGTATDYTEKTLLVKGGRGLLVNKNFEPEDYPEGGYIFNNAARHGVDFKDYGALVRITGTDTGTSTPTTLDDPPSGLAGYPVLQSDNFTVTQPLQNAGDVSSPTKGLGQSYFLALPVLAVLGEYNSSTEARLDRNYPGYNFNISDQRRALEFCKDFDRMVQQGTLPTYLYIYQPNDHTGSVQAPNGTSIITNGPLQQIADGDVALGMVVDHLMKSKAYFNPQNGTGAAIFITYDDAQSSLDHIHPHRTPLVVVSPFAKPGYVAKRHYVTASIVKTEELLMGLPPNNYGDLFATDLRDLFQSTPNGITADSLHFTKTCRVTPSVEGKRIWALVAKLDTSAPDRDSLRLGRLARLSAQADLLHRAAAHRSHLQSPLYQSAQVRLYQRALALVGKPAPRDTDG